jgi:hypothetical protein
MKTRITILAGTLVLALFTAASTAVAVEGAERQRSTKQVQRQTVVVDHGPTVLVESTYGDIQVEPWLHDKVSLVSDGRHGSVRATVTHLPNNTVLVSITGTDALAESAAPRVKHTLRLPAHSALTMFIDRGSVDIRDVVGVVECNVNSGDIRLENVDNVKELSCAGGMMYTIIRTADGLVSIPTDPIQ